MRKKAYPKDTNQLAKLLVDMAVGEEEKSLYPMPNKKKVTRLNTIKKSKK